MKNAKSRLTHIKENGHRVFLDPSRPVWFVVNEKGAEVIDGLMKGHASAEDAECLRFLEELKKNDLLSKAIHEVNEYRGRSEYLENEDLEELWLHVTDLCNLECRHCLVGAGKACRSRGEELSKDEICGIIDEARSLGVRRFFFSGGEPFLRRDIFDLIEKVTEKDQLVILTNGSMIRKNMENIKKLRNSDRLLFQISLEGHKKEVHEGLRGKGSFDGALEGIRTLVALDLTPVVAMTLTRVNISSVEAVNRLLKDMGVRFHHLLWLHKRGRAAVNSDLYVSPEEIGDAIERLIDVSTETGVAVTLDKAACVRVGGRRDVKYDLCHAGCTTLAIGADGTAYPCGALVGEERLSCGSVPDRGLKDVWENSERLRDIRNASLIDVERCGSCRFRYYCGGGCISYKYFENGSLSGLDPYCGAYQMLYESAMIRTVRERCRDIEPVEDKPFLYAASCPPAKLPDGSAIDVRSFHCACVLTTKDESKKSCG